MAMSDWSRHNLAVESMNELSQKNGGCSVNISKPLTNSMKHIPVFHGTTNSGILKLYNRQKFNAWLLSLGNKNVTLSVEPKKKHRSHNQNAYYWGVVIDLLAYHFGYTPEEMHEALKWKFLRVDGPVPTVRSTRKLTTKEFMEFIEKVQIWAASEYQVDIPSPNEVNYQV
jgi:hypothetical protein